jgi:hypothetical protein
MNRWVDGAGVDADDETLSDRGIFLAEEGYSKKNADIQPEAA